MITQIPYISAKNRHPKNGSNFRGGKRGRVELNKQNMWRCGHMFDDMLLIQIFNAFMLANDDDGLNKTTTTTPSFALSMVVAPKRLK